MRSILVSGESGPGAEVRLQAAIDLAGFFGAHLTVLFSLPVSRYVGFDGIGGSYVVADALEQARADEDKAVATLEQRLTREGVPFDVVRSEEEPGAAIASAARLADLIVLSRSNPLAGDVVLMGQVPVLALPDEGRLVMPPRSACVGWNGGDEAAAAVRAAVPLLAKCEKVQVVRIAEKAGGYPGTDVLRYLSRHGICAELNEVERNGSVEETLAAAVSQSGADLLVIGAYGKSRLREYLFGGVTAHFLQDQSAPALLLAH
ncbi:universal stress protein [Novosphingobium sp. M1R2S20]|uniref:Universal stress protein n=1 Tax=Novosphingobium rhizovicinum TaxID=3228928 RepID=A0ABV3RAE7_9SPHN